MYSILKKHNKKIFSFFLTLGIILVAPIISLAQSMPSIGGLTPNANINLTATPEFPRAGEQVTIVAESFYMDLDRSAIGWYVNGTRVAEGTGLKQFTVDAGALGVSKTISILAVQGTKRATQSIFINPAEVDMLWEAKTYTPPFYKGKAPYTPQADLLVHAVANLKGYSGTNIVYEWKKNGQQIARGAGLDTLTLSGDELTQSFILSVQAESSDKKTRAFSSKTFSPVLASIVTYQYSPTQGVLFNRALGTNPTFPEQEFTIAAFPFGFSTPNRYLSPAPIAWTINGTKDSQSTGKPNLTFRKEGEGKASIGVFAQSSSKIAQFANTTLHVQLND
ncbi:MAG TPA: hypothetical protein PLF31_02745 [Candidatus Paceibacterota bacterium]|nr:hypothetical protein [Candidatus Paceibacterota bacterium]